MSPTQQFRLSNDVESITLRKDANGTLFSQIDDITNNFPEAVRSKVNGTSILFLQNENGQRCEPKRIAYYSDAIVDVVIAAHASNPSVSQIPGSGGTVSLSTLSLCFHSSSTFQALARILQGTPNELLARLMATISSIASDTTYIQHQLDYSTEQQSVNHRHLLE
ncbi:hypothetical protein BGZ47_010156 [Haplosporangium gracile]|nr:hypothetical protein BGZ47_010156 [Haplosporangium gracile]